MGVIILQRSCTDGLGAAIPRRQPRPWCALTRTPLFVGFLAGLEPRESAVSGAAAGGGAASARAVGQRAKHAEPRAPQPGPRLSGDAENAGGGGGRQRRRQQRLRLARGGPQQPAQRR